MVSRFEPVFERKSLSYVKVVIMVKVILVIFVSGMRFQCHYINIIKIIFYIVSRKESVKSFLTLMTNDLNDQLRTMTITMTAIRIEAINLHKMWSFGHWSFWSFSFSTSNPITINYKLLNFRKCFLTTEFMRLRVHLLCKRLNAKAFGVHRELRIISSARRLCVLRRLRPTQIAQNSYPLYLCGLN